MYSSQNCTQPVVGGSTGKPVFQQAPKLVSIALLLLSGAAAHTAAAQQSGPGSSHADLTVSYTADHAKLANVSGSSFWLSGASAEAGFSVHRGLAIAFEIAGGHVSNIDPGVNLSKLSYAAGPRYTLDTSQWTSRWSQGRSSGVFAKALIGVAHAFDGLFPSINGLNYKATSPAIELGGGLGLALTKGLSLRLPELDYLHTSLPNNGSNSQNDLRLSAGLSLHLHRLNQAN